jgi:hypothetical protein
MNVLSNVDNFHRPLDRILSVARKSVILRESAGDTAEYAYVRDKYLDDGVDLSVHVNTYATADVLRFIEDRGFAVQRVQDRHTGGRVEMVIDHPHRWTFFVADRLA